MAINEAVPGPLESCPEKEFGGRLEDFACCRVGIQVYHDLQFAKLNKNCYRQEETMSVSTHMSTRILVIRKK